MTMFDANCKIASLTRDERGSALVLVALAIVALLGFTALTVDTGILLLNKSRVANAVDSAVLAGAQELPVDPDGALEVARQYAIENGIETGEAAFSVSGDNLELHGEALRSVGLFFARVLGFNQGEVGVHAAARVGPLGSGTGCVPLGVIKEDFQFGQQYTLKEGAGDGQHKGWFGCLELGGSGANVYRDNIKFGYDGEIEVGDIIDVKHGNNSGPTSQGISYRINQCDHTPQCSISHFEKSCPRVMLVPIVVPEEVNPGGAVQTVRVVGFGAFLVDKVPGSGKENEVTGYFIRMVTTGAIDPNAENVGVYGVELFE